jgi:hypothetical protein
VILQSERGGEAKKLLCVPRMDCHMHAVQFPSMRLQAAGSWQLFDA